jgi:cytochrome c556
MKKPALIASIAMCTLLAAPLTQAASRLEFGVWMRSIDAKTVSVQKHLAAGRKDEAVADAQALQKLYADMAVYFEHDYPAADAVGFSHDGEKLAAAIPGHVANGDLTAAAQSARAIALACNDCHDPYKPLP